MTSSINAAADVVMEDMADQVSMVFMAATMALDVEQDPMVAMVVGGNDGRATSTTIQLGRTKVPTLTRRAVSLLRPPTPRLEGFNRRLPEVRPGHHYRRLLLRHPRCPRGLSSATVMCRL